MSGPSPTDGALPREVLPAIERGLAAFGLEPAAAPALAAYLQELVRWNAAYNLTAVREPADMVPRHLLDSLSVLAPVDALLAARALAPRLLDVGAGAGLPGIPLAILRPQWQITLLDSNGKKARFLRHAQRSLGLANVEVAQARVEAFRPAGGPFPLILSRAFASLGDFLRQSAPLLAPDGRWLAMKGKVSPEELQGLPAGMQIEDVHPLSVPQLREARCLVVVRRG